MLDELDANGNAIVDGNPFPNAPEWSGDFTLDYTVPIGTNGDLFFFTLGGASIAPVDLGLTMPLALGPPFQSVVLGVLPEGEQLLTQIPLSPFGPGFGGRTLSFQGAFVSASTGVLELALPGTMTLLESAY